MADNDGDFDNFSFVHKNNNMSELMSAGNHGESRLKTEAPQKHGRSALFKQSFAAENDGAEEKNLYYDEFDAGSADRSLTESVPAEQAACILNDTHERESGESF